MDHEHMMRYLRTPAGCDGGNLHGRHWTFGLEPGGGESLEFYRNPPIEDWQGYVDENSSPTPFADAAKKYPFRYRVAKLEAAKHGWETSDYLEFAEAHRLYAKDSDFYRGNLGAFPIVNMNADTYNTIADAIGIPDRQKFNQVQDKVRGPMFREWVAYYSPLCLICFGNSESNDQNLYRYLEIFTPGDPKIEWLGKVQKNHAYHKIINDGKTHLFVLPHPTPGGGGGTDMGSDEGISALGRLIAERIW